MSISRRLLIAALVMVCVPLSVASAQDTLVFSTFPSSAMTAVFRDVLSEAYQRIGIAIEVEELPAERALMLADSGTVDGEAGRMTAIESVTSNLVRISVPIFTAKTYVFTRDLKIQVDGFNSLRPYKIGILTGYKFVEKMVADMDHVIVPKYEDLFFMLNDGYVDVVIMAERDGVSTLKSMGLISIQPLTPPLDESPMYHYLHVRHNALVPRITTVLEDMQREGRIQAIADQYANR